MLSPDGRLLAVVRPDKVELWEVASGQPCATINTPAHNWLIAQFSPDGRRLARAHGTSVLLFDVLHGRQIQAFDGHLMWVNRLAFTANGRRLVSGSRDSTMLVWNVAAPRQRGEPAKAPNAAAVAAAWDKLAGSAAKAGFEAVRLLVEAPDAAVPLLRERLRPAAPVNIKHLQQRIRDLDSDSFDTRQAATAALEQGGGHAEQAVRQALRTQPSLEARRRLQAILRKLSGTTTPETLRTRRAVWALEWIGTPQAEAVLRTLAAGSPGAWQSQDARAALERLQRRRMPH